MCPGVCADEFACVQMDPRMLYPAPRRTRAELYAALEDCAAGGAGPTPEMTALFECLMSHERTVVCCLGGDAPAGTAGAGGTS